SIACPPGVSCAQLNSRARFYPKRAARGRRAPRTALGGLRYAERNAALKRRTLANPAANAIVPIGSVVSSTRTLARCTRRVVATAAGDAPAWRTKSRRRCRAVMPSVSARSSTVWPSSRKPRSMSRMARETVAAAPCHAGVPGAVSGRHPQAGAEARSLGGGRRGEEHDVARPGRLHGTGGPAVDPGGQHAGEEPPVEPTVARQPCTIAGAPVEGDASPHGPRA